MKQLLVFIRKEFKHVFRDNKSLLMLFGLPIAQIVLFGFALTNEIKNSRIIICDNAQDASSIQITERIAQSRNFLIKEVIVDKGAIEASFKEGDVKIVVVFPNNFHKDLHHLGKAQMQVIADASDPNTAATLTSYIEKIVEAYQQKINKTMPGAVTISFRINDFRFHRERKRKRYHGSIIGLPHESFYSDHRQGYTVFLSLAY
jgi:ABC-2 type transport system permease protein